MVDLAFAPRFGEPRRGEHQPTLCGTVGVLRALNTTARRWALADGAVVDISGRHAAVRIVVQGHHQWTAGATVMRKQRVDDPVVCVDNIRPHRVGKFPETSYQDRIR